MNTIKNLRFIDNSDYMWQEKLFRYGSRFMLADDIVQMPDLSFHRKMGIWTFIMGMRLRDSLERQFLMAGNILEHKSYVKFLGIDHLINPVRDD